jgi:hypothetical protein
LQSDFEYFDGLFLCQSSSCFGISRLFLTHISTWRCGWGISDPHTKLKHKFGWLQVNNLLICWYTLRYLWLETLKVESGLPWK